MTHSRPRIAHRRPAHHGNIGSVLAQLAISIIGGMARNKMVEKAHQRQTQNAKKQR